MSGSRSPQQSLGRNLVLASTAGRTSKVQYLLNQGAPVKTRDEMGLTSLMRAAQAGHLEITRLFLDAGALHNVLSTYGERTAVSFAIENRHADIVELLLSAGADPNVVGSAFATPHAAARGYTEIVRLLVGDVNLPLSATALLEGSKAIWTAAVYGNLDLVNCLLETGIPADAFNKEGASLLQCVSAEGKSDMVSLLLDAGADINRQGTCEDLTALYLAAQNGHADVVKKLLEKKRGADIELANYRGVTPLYVASATGEGPIVALLLAAGADSNASMDEGTVPLIAAAGYTDDAGKCLDVLGQLLDAGADINAVKDGHITSLNYACYHNNLAAVKLLLQRGADPSISDIKGRSPLLMSAVRGYVEQVKLLLDAGADAEIKYQGLTIIQHADKCGHPAVVEVLIDWLVQRWG